MRIGGLPLCICWLLLLLSAKAHASWNYLQPKVLGFTADGDTFVYIERNWQTVHPNQEIEAVRYDIRTIKEQRFPYRRSEPMSRVRSKSRFKLGSKKIPPSVWAVRALQMTNTR